MRSSVFLTSENLLVLRVIFDSLAHQRNDPPEKDDKSNEQHDAEHRESNHKRKAENKELALRL